GRAQEAHQGTGRLFGALRKALLIREAGIPYHRSERCVVESDLAAVESGIAEFDLAADESGADEACADHASQYRSVMSTKGNGRCGSSGFPLWAVSGQK